MVSLDKFGNNEDYERSSIESYKVAFEIQREKIEITNMLKNVKFNEDNDSFFGKIVHFFNKDHLVDSFVKDINALVPDKKTFKILKQLKKAIKNKNQDDIRTILEEIDSMGTTKMEFVGKSIAYVGGTLASFKLSTILGIIVGGVGGTFMYDKYKFLKEKENLNKLVDLLYKDKTLSLHMKEGLFAVFYGIANPDWEEYILEKIEKLKNDGMLTDYNINRVLVSVTSLKLLNKTNKAKVENGYLKVDLN